MQNQLHTIDPSLRANTLSSPPKSYTQRYQERLPAQAYSPLRTSPTGNPYPNTQTPNYYSSGQQTNESPEYHSPDGHVHNPDDLKRPRACEACRSLKVKCEIDESIPGAACKRCTKAQRQCIVTVPSRKRQKKTDSRVAELEKKIDALTATLAARGGAGAGPTDADPALDQNNTAEYGPPRNTPYNGQWPPETAHMTPRSPPSLGHRAGVKRKPTELFEPFGGELRRPSSSLVPPSASLAVQDPRPRPPSTEPPPPSHSDVVDRGLIDVKTAYKCFDRYVNEMCQHLPVVVFPPGVQAENVRKSHPILFQAIIAVACGTIRPDLQPKLVSDATRILADRIVSGGEKSLELVQTIQIMTIWYQPPERYEELNFNQLVHIAAVVAMDIGMGKRSRKGALSKRNKNKLFPDSTASETRRCWLGCYYMCSNSSMSLRRPLLVRWSPYAEECLEILESASDALPSDRWLCHIVRAQHIAETIGAEFAMDDPAQELSITDSSVQHHLKALELKLEEWVKRDDNLMQSPIMKHTQAIINLYMHEIAMHNEHNIDDFRPPYHATPIEGPPDPASVTPIHVTSLSTCLQAAHAAFDAFLSMDIHVLRSLPTHFFVRNSYAAVALIKLYTAISAKGSTLGAIYGNEDLRVDYYLERLIELLTRVAEGNKSKVAWKFSMIFHMLLRWHIQRTESPGHASREHSQPRAPVKNSDGHPPKHEHTQPRQMSEQSQPPQIQMHRLQAWQQPRNETDRGRTGLQMLSDAAMRPGLGPPGGQPQQTSSGQWLTPSHGPHLIPPMVPSASMSNPTGDPNVPPGLQMNDPMMTYGMPPGEITSFLDFTSDELMAYGFGDEFMAMSFGFENGGSWAT